MIDPKDGVSRLNFPEGFVYDYLFKTRLERPFRLATKWMTNLTDLSNYYKNTNVKKCLILPKLNDTKLYKLTACDKTL